MDTNGGGVGLAIFGGIVVGGIIIYGDIKAGTENGKNEAKNEIKAGHWD